MAAASESYIFRSNDKFLPIDQGLSRDSMIFDLDESELWNSAPLSPLQTPEFGRPTPRISMNPAAKKIGQASVPVSIPDWSKILKHEYKENRRCDCEGDDYDGEENGSRVPPHEFLARNRIASLSVHEGIGRTLKGRDLSRVRNAIWQKTGFQD